MPSKSLEHRKLRVQLINLIRKGVALNPLLPSAGNCSLRILGGMLIKPSGKTPEKITPETIATVRFDQEGYEGPCPPSTEKRFHVEIYKARPEVNCIVHTHSPHAQAFSTGQRPLVPFSYLNVLAGRENSIPCTCPFQPAGSQELADQVRELAETGTRIIYLANHGLIALGTSGEDALKLAMLGEVLAQNFLIAKAANLEGFHILSDEEMARQRAELTGTAYDQNKK